MIDQRYRDLAGAAAEAARPPEFASVRRRAGRLRTRRRAGGALAVAVLAASGVAGVAALRPAGGIDPAAGGGRIVAADGYDAEHLYAIEADCDDCPRELIASSDGGRSWDERGVELPATAAPRLTVLGPEVLLFSWVDSRTDLNSFPPDPSPSATGTPPGTWGGIPEWAVSVDGGRSLRDIEVTDTPVAAATRGTRLVRCFDLGLSEPCPLYAVDPVSGRFAPLANQPSFMVWDDIEAPASAGLWVMGYDKVTRRPAVAVSEDQGRTWQTRPIGDTNGANNWDVATTDGNVVYAMFSRAMNVGITLRKQGQTPVVPEEPAVRPMVFRSTDGGVHWDRVDDVDIDGRVSRVLPGSMVAVDGTHILAAEGPSGWRWVGSVDGRSYRPMTLRGLPALGAKPQSILPPRAIAERFFIYLYQERLYTSTDGRNWRPVGS